MADNWGSVLAAIAGGLKGYAGGMQDIDEQRRREEDAEARRQERAASLEIRRAAEERQRVQDEAQAATAATAAASTQLDRGRALYGSDQDIPEAMAAIAGRAGRGNEITNRMSVDPADLATSAATMSPLGPMALPSVASRFVPTAAERQQQQTAATVRELAEKLRGVNPATATAMDVGATTGKMPTLGPDAFTPPKTADQIAAEAAAKEDASFGAWKRRQDYNEGQVRSRPEKGPPVTRDDPKMPNGVRAYLGQLTAKFGDDRVGALEELRRSIPSLQQAHPGLDLHALQQQFGAVFPKPDADTALMPPGPPIARPAATTPAPPGPPVTPAAAASPADASPGQVRSAKADLAAAIQSGDMAKVAAARARLAAAAGR